jgi:hypothetical protein
MNKTDLALKLAELLLKHSLGVSYVNSEYITEVKIDGDFDLVCVANELISYFENR